jgi:hypothetical protein
VKDLASTAIPSQILHCFQDNKNVVPTLNARRAINKTIFAASPRTLHSALFSFLKKDSALAGQAV